MRTSSRILAECHEDNFNGRPSGKLLCEFTGTLDTKNQRKILCLKSVAEKAIIADFLKAYREYMHQESADEFRTGNGNRLLAAGFVVTGEEGDHTILKAHDSGVGNSNFVSISSEILNGISIAIEGLLDEAIPILGIELVTEEIPFERIFKERASSWEAKLSVVV